MSDKNKIYENLIKNQLNSIDNKHKLNLSDLKRIADNLLDDIFGNECSIWCGPIITNSTNKSYISFFYNSKKISIHRILYKNYINNLGDNEYLKYTCKNQGICCCVNHFYKVNNNTNILDDHKIETTNFIDFDENQKILKKNISVSF